MRVALDTNVLVSGLLSPFGTCGAVVRMVTTDLLTLCVDARILIEYEEVLRRPRLHIAPVLSDTVMDYIRTTAESCPARPLRHPLPDPEDAAFLEVAIAARVDALVTGNLKHYPPRCREGVRVLSPAAFLPLC